RAEPFERDDLLARIDARQRSDAGAHRLAVDVHRAGAALAEPAAEARALERKVVAQCIKERHLRVIDVDRNRAPIDAKRFALNHGWSPQVKARSAGASQWLQSNSADAWAPPAHSICWNALLARETPARARDRVDALQNTTPTTPRVLTGKGHDDTSRPTGFAAISNRPGSLAIQLGYADSSD